MTFDLSVNGKETEPENQWKYTIHPAYYIPSGESPNYRLAESNIGFDASKDINFEETGFDDSKWKPQMKFHSKKQDGTTWLTDLYRLA